ARTGDLLFGLDVRDLRVGPHAINDGGRIAFLLQIGAGGTATSHVVLATPRRGPQTIAFPGLADQAFGAAPVGVTATATSGLAVTFAANVSRVLSVARAGQTIDFAMLPDRTFGDLPFAVSAAASSGLAVSLTAGGNCTIAGGVLTLGGGGSCTATASQAGNADYEPAA